MATARPTPPHRRGPDPVKRAAILRAARSAFARNGYHGASLRDICGACDASIGLIAHHFGSKAELYRAVLRHELDTLPMDAGFVEVFVADDDPRRGFAGLVRQLALFALGTRSRKRALVHIVLHELRNPTPMLPLITSRFPLRVREAFEVLLRRIAPDADEASIRDAAVHALVLATETVRAAPVLALIGLDIPTDEARARAYADRITSLLLRGVLHGGLS